MEEGPPILDPDEIQEVADEDFIPPLFELECDDGGIYECHVFDITDDRIVVQLESGEIISGSHEKIKYKKKVPPLVRAKLGKVVEVYKERDEDGTVYGWFKASVLSKKGNIYVTELAPCGDTNHKAGIRYIVEIGQMRHPRQDSYLKSNFFKKFEYDIPPHFEEWYSNPELHTMLCKSAKALTVRFNNNTFKLLIISGNLESQEIYAVLENVHQKFVVDNSAVLERINIAERCLCNMGTIKYAEEFTIDTKYIGFALGPLGQHIRDAQNIEGIRHVHFFHQASKFQILGDNENVVKEARDLLEYRKSISRFPYRFTSQLVDSSGSFLQELADLCDSRVSLLNRCNQDEYASVEMLGFTGNLAKAEWLLQTRVKHLERKEKAHQQQQELYKMVASLSQPIIAKKSQPATTKNKKKETPSNQQGKPPKASRSIRRGRSRRGRGGLRPRGRGCFGGGGGPTRVNSSDEETLTLAAVAATTSHDNLEVAKPDSTITSLGTTNTCSAAEEPVKEVAGSSVELDAKIESTPVDDWADVLFQSTNSPSSMVVEVSDSSIVELIEDTNTYPPDNAAQESTPTLDGADVPLQEATCPSCILEKLSPDVSNSSVAPRINYAVQESTPETNWDDALLEITPFPGVVVEQTTVGEGIVFPSAVKNHSPQVFYAPTIQLKSTNNSPRVNYAVQKSTPESDGDDALLEITPSPRVVVEQTTVREGLVSPSAKQQQFTEEVLHAPVVSLEITNNSPSVNYEVQKSTPESDAEDALLEITPSPRVVVEQTTVSEGLVSPSAVQQQSTEEVLHAPVVSLEITNTSPSVNYAVQESTPASNWDDVLLELPASPSPVVATQSIVDNGLILPSAVRRHSPQVLYAPSLPLDGSNNYIPANATRETIRATISRHAFPSRARGTTIPSRARGTSFPSRGANFPLRGSLFPLRSISDEQPKRGLPYHWTDQHFIEEAFRRIIRDRQFKIRAVTLLASSAFLCFLPTYNDTFTQALADSLGLDVTTVTLLHEAFQIGTEPAQDETAIGNNEGPFVTVTSDDTVTSVAEERTGRKRDSCGDESPVKKRKHSEESSEHATLVETTSVPGSIRPGFYFGRPILEVPSCTLSYCGNTPSEEVSTDVALEPSNDLVSDQPNSRDTSDVSIESTTGSPSNAKGSGNEEPKDSDK